MQKELSCQDPEIGSSSNRYKSDYKTTQEKDSSRLEAGQQKSRNLIKGDPSMRAESCLTGERRS